jgi:hypothetical protein
MPPYRAPYPLLITFVQAPEYHTYSRKSISGTEPKGFLTWVFQDSAVVQDPDGDGKIVYLFLPLYTVRTGH